jgi:hypothetical protein
MAIVEEGDAGPDARKLRASYSFWSVDRREDVTGDLGESAPLALEERRVDELVLARGKKGGWRIVGLERTILP